LKRFSTNYGAGFEQRAQEAARCYETGNYLACCALCGAAAESMLLAAAMTLTRDPSAVLRDYRSANGTRKVIERALQRGSKARGNRRFEMASTFLAIGETRLHMGK
jgi:hypothetical protein